MSDDLRADLTELDKAHALTAEVAYQAAGKAEAALEMAARLHETIDQKFRELDESITAIITEAVKRQVRG